MPRFSSKPIFLIAILSVCAVSQADIRYKVVCRPEQNQLRIEMTIPSAGDALQVQIPNWAPGSYRLVDNFARVKEFTVTGSTGEVLAFTNDKNTWTINGAAKAKDVVVGYTMDQLFVDGVMHWAGPSTYMYVVNRKPEKCFLEVETPDSWTVMTGLDEVRGDDNTFVASDYDVLADNPVSAGDLLVDTYRVLGKPHYIVMRNRYRSEVDRAYLKKACEQVTKGQANFFGGLPYNKYVWHFAVTDAADGAGGLEHLSSTQISLSSGVGPRAVSVLWHEFFHLWNVKRIRSRVLGPFDYNVLPKTGALWWLEGVTDYYAQLLPYRYSWWGRNDFYESIVANVGQVRGNAAHLEVSPYESSFRVGEAANGRGNSNGYRISYYDLGWVAGMLLDIELRHVTNGKHSLDDVTHALWEMNKNNQPGFEEDEIRRQLVKFGGLGMGYFYDRVVLKASAMPVEEELAKVGLQLVEVDEPRTDVGFAYVVNTDQGGAVVGTLTPPGQGKLERNDVIVAVNGKELKGSRRSMTELLTKEFAAARPGQALKLRVKRGEAVSDVEITPAATTAKRKRVIEDPNASAQAKQLREQWLAQRRA